MNKKDLARNAHYDSRREDRELIILARIYTETRNPFAALRALEVCLDENRPLDEWPDCAKTYLNRSVTKLLALRPKEKRIRERKDPEGKPERAARVVKLLDGGDVLRALGFTGQGQARQNRVEKFAQDLVCLELFFAIEDRVVDERAANPRRIQKQMIQDNAKRIRLSERAIADRFRVWRRALYR